MVDRFTSLDSWKLFRDNLNQTSPHPLDMERFAAFVVEAQRHRLNWLPARELFKAEFDVTQDVLDQLVARFDPLYSFGVNVFNALDI